MDFIERVEKDNMELFVRKYFEKIWEHFDVDKGGVLNQKEFTNLMRSVTGKKIKKKDAHAFLSHLDSDGNKVADKK
jgi:Ca2+-binding EF-hand superfamily protein